MESIIVYGCAEVVFSSSYDESSLMSAEEADIRSCQLIRLNLVNNVDEALELIKKHCGKSYFEGYIRDGNSVYYITEGETHLLTEDELKEFEEDRNDSGTSAGSRRLKDWLKSQGRRR